MLTKVIYLYLLFYLIPLFSFAQAIQESENHRIIIDTDCALDDLRAINLFLSSTNTDILAITSEDGVLEPDEGFMKIISLLNDLGHQGIPIAQGIISKNAAPEWRGLAQQANWGEEPISYSEPLEIKEFLIQTIEQEEEPVEIICMGPLTNIANAVLMKPSIKQLISKIIWFDQCQPDVPWTNYGMDCLSGDYLLNTKIPISRIVAREEPLAFSKTFLEKIGKIQTPYAQKIYDSHLTNTIRDSLQQGDFKIRDELTALYFYYPELFTADTTHSSSPEGNAFSLIKKDKVKDQYLKHLQSYNRTENVVYQDFPTDSTHYRQDIKEFMHQTIDRYGIREWKAVTLTGEIQHHLGLYALLGAKMGIRVLEYFHTSPENIELTSYCGNTPPLSCVNDGLQVSTGTTTGQGNFRVRDKGIFPKARVQYKNKTILIELKTDYNQELEAEAEAIRKRHPLSSDSYLKEIREKALHYWEKWDRKQIFRISEINP